MAFLFAVTSGYKSTVYCIAQRCYAPFPVASSQQRFPHGSKLIAFIYIPSLVVVHEYIPIFIVLTFLTLQVCKIAAGVAQRYRFFA